MVKMKRLFINRWILTYLVSCTLIATSNGELPDLGLKSQLDHELTNFDIVSPSSVRTKRDIGSDSLHSVELFAFNQTLRLLMHRSTATGASANLKIRSVSYRGRGVPKQHRRQHLQQEEDEEEEEVKEEKEVDLPTEVLMNDFYVGSVEGHRNSRISGFIDADKLYCTIHMDDDVITIEPLSGITGNTSDHRLLIYKDSNLRQNAYSCGVDTSNSRKWSSRDQQQRRQHQQQLQRHPRSMADDASSTKSSTSSSSTRPRLVCRLQLVADYTFFDRVCSKSVPVTVKSLVKIVDDVNEIYSSTDFIHPSTGELLPRIGFELSSAIVLETPSQHTAGPSHRRHFNYVNPSIKWSGSELLEAFGDYHQNGISHSKHCLSHLVTFRPLLENMLGLAYLGSQYQDRLGGICSTSSWSTFSRQTDIARNTGFVSYSNTDSHPILSRRAVLVTAHELGHNMGSEHDPETSRLCFPAWVQGGPYLMHRIAVMGNAPNHHLFSECSRKQMAFTLKGKSSCLQEPQQQFCGNRRQEGSEQCDAGPRGDRCCTERCQLRHGALCSDVNCACCIGCKPAAKSTICRPLTPLHPCQAETRCNGRDHDCPPANNRPDNTTCHQGVGLCKSGRCLSICSLLGMRSCNCENLDDACRVCCAYSNNTCAAFHDPVSKGTVQLPENMPCIIGSCLANGTCAKTGFGNGHVIVRLWDLIRNIRTASFRTLLWKNVVFAVVLVSLLFWIPACMLISYQDRVDASQEQQLQQQQQQRLPSGALTFGGLDELSPSSQSNRPLTRETSATNRSP